MFIRHGSEDSLDKDYYIVVEKPFETIQDSKNFCDKFDGIDANPITIHNGKVSWCFKGIQDEVNNSIFKTYNFHSENTSPCPIISLVERDKKEKVERTIRGILSYFTRTHFRISVKQALKNTDINSKIEVLSSISFIDVEDFGKKQSKKEVYKFMAFQLGQTLSLLKEEELFTKKEVAEKYPKLEPLLYRRDCDNSAITLNSFLKTFIEVIKNESLLN